MTLVFLYSNFFSMKLINTRDRSYNGIRKGETIDIKNEDQIVEYLDAWFEKVGKEEMKAISKDADKKWGDEKNTPVEDNKTGSTEVK